jgi:glycosyltransferase involved in cell wall biosynthesis
VHCNDYNTMWIGVAAKLLFGARLVYDSHELWPDRNLRPEPRGWLLFCEALFMRAADHVITTSPGHSQVMGRRYRTGQPQVVRNIPEPSATPPGDFRTNGRSPLAVYFGAVTSGRGLEAVLEALALVGDERIRLRILGPEAWGYRERLEGLAEKLGVDARVEFAGAVSPAEAGSALADADVGLALIEPACLSYELTLPNKLFEYTAAGLPILGADLPVIAEFVHGHRLGATAAPDRPDEIARVLEALLEPERNRSCADAARRTAASLTWEKESRLLEAIYGDLLSRRP